MRTSWPFWSCLTILAGALMAVVLALPPVSLANADAQADPQPDAPAENPEEPGPVPPPPGVPPLLVGQSSYLASQAGRLFTEGTQRAYLTDTEERRLLSLEVALSTESPSAPLIAASLLAVPVRQLWDPVLDGDYLPVLPEDLEPKDPKERLRLEFKWGEWQAYCDAVKKAYDFKAPQFAASARHDVSWHTLVSNPRRHRGEVVHIEGNLRRLYKHEPLLMVRTENLPALYEGWVFEDDSNDPWCIVFTELPKGLIPDGRLNQPVVFDGYFFKKLGYQNESRQEVSAPFLIGNSPVLRGPSTQAGLPGIQGWTSILLYGVVGVVTLLVFLGVGLTLWFRRGDAEVRHRLTELAHKHFVDPSTVSPEMPEAAGELGELSDPRFPR